MAEVLVTLWFDTEDYITPIADDGAKGVAELLTRLGVQGTFKVVGEKARVMKQRGRDDVIESLKKHDIGYHTDFHSVHPTISEFLRDKEWDEGVEEFDRREHKGLRDVEAIFDTRCSSYGQPGSSWAAQVFPVLHRWGVPLYLDDGGHVGLNDEPFWYCGILNVFRLRKSTPRLNLRPEIEPIDKANREFDEIYDRLNPSGGIISIYYHPLEWVTEEFWDGVNFAKGANPPREQWKPATVTKPEVIMQRFAAFEQYVSHMKTKTDVRFVTGREILELYPDTSRTHAFSPNELLEVARSFKPPHLTFVRIGDMTISLAEALVLLCNVASNPQQLRPVKLPSQLYGPRKRASRISPPPYSASLELVRTARRLLESVSKDHHIPDNVLVDGAQLSPGDFLVACARLCEKILRRQTIPERILVESTHNALESEIGEDDRMWGWVIFPEGFRAPKILELAKLQTWTLKPAGR